MRYSDAVASRNKGRVIADRMLGGFGGKGPGKESVSCSSIAGVRGIEEYLVSCAQYQGTLVLQPHGSLKELQTTSTQDYVIVVQDFESRCKRRNMKHNPNQLVFLQIRVIADRMSSLAENMFHILLFSGLQKDRRTSFAAVFHIFLFSILCVRSTEVHTHWGSNALLRKVNCRRRKSGERNT